MNKLQVLANKLKIKLGQSAYAYDPEDDYMNDQFYTALNRYEDDYLYNSSYEELYTELKKLKGEANEYLADEEEIPALLKAKMLMVKNLMEKIQK